MPVFDRLLRSSRLRKPAHLLSPQSQEPSEPDLAAVSSFTADNRIFLNIQNRHGSVEHYYHFVLGFMVPLILRPPPPPRTSVSVISCGPMDAHLKALQLPWLDILSRQAWLEQRRANRGPSDIALGLDDPEFYDPAAFERARRLIWQHVGVVCPKNDETLLLVNRGKSPDFYQSDAAQTKTSANLRRKIPNILEIEAVLTRRSQPVRMVELETSTFQSQVALFARTRLLVAQHGAALANMLWMAPSAAILEINPEPPGGKFHSYFRLLAEACGHRYASVAQRHPFAPVSANAVRDAVRALRDANAR